MSTITYRPLSKAEIETLERLGNSATDWQTIMVAPGTDLNRVRNNSFDGRVCFGPFGQEPLTDGLLSLPQGISGSHIANSTIGPNSALHRVAYMSGYTTGEGCLLSNIGELTAGGELQYIEVMNECGGRRLLPFAGMTMAQAYIWARYRDREALMDRLDEMTRRHITANGGMGVIGDAAVVRNTVHVSNVIVCSSKQAPSRIVDCITLTDGVIGYGCNLTYGVVAQRFLLGENVHLEYSLRLNDTVVGDNSTLARGEVACSIIFPAHEQHHNSSFLIAALVMGQSNVASGATLGSNHNGRTADGELAVGRGFWPGLCVSLKHTSRMASYTLLAKADYPSELNITLPFALINNNTAKNRLEVMPAYWWLYNMYALDRNGRKFAKRDKRVYARQHIEFAPLAPDTAEEIMLGRDLLRMWTEKAYAEAKLQAAPADVADALAASTPIEVQAYGMERGKRKTVILKPGQGYRAYTDMLVYYAMGQLAERYGNQLPDATALGGERCVRWVNWGGQLIPGSEADRLLADIEAGRLSSWQEVENRLDELWTAYPEQKMHHAYQTLCALSQVKSLDEAEWNKYLAQYAELQQYVADQVKVTRQKDDDNEFRKSTYWNEAEMKNVLQ
ncbi:MAG: DUF4954 family protein [Bacteroidales bacterium]|nr:DUF4954 family protein [Bacteroidales bacterium]